MPRHQRKAKQGASKHMKVSGTANQPMNIAYLAPELGALTSTFIYREVGALRKRGVTIALFSTSRPSDSQISEEALAIVEETCYLYDAPVHNIAAGAARHLIRHPLRSGRALALLVRDVLFAQTSTPADRLKMFWHFLTGCHLGMLLEQSHVEHIHAHFAHVPAAIAMYAAHMAGISFSFTAHANDLFERGTALKEKVGRAAFTAVISEYNRRFLEGRGCLAERIHLVHCGLDVSRYEFRPARPENSPPLVFSVGRFVEKKGFHILIRALALLQQQQISFRCVIAGTGPLFGPIQAQSESLGLAGCLEMPGGMPQERVKAMFDTADVFVLPCVVAESGDQDGIPVALMEAMALGVPVVSTGVSGIPELIADGENGLLAGAGDPAALAQAIRQIMQDSALGQRLAKQARATIEEHFNVETIATNLESLFRASIVMQQQTGGTE